MQSDNEKMAGKMTRKTAGKTVAEQLETQLAKQLASQSQAVPKEPLPKALTGVNERSEAV
jgi:hypothetical protein